ncbi:hypothetical protein OH77DRAFT_223751 [Trametes cingulata]|nr:hypothetical protein OH77DRAFT_223751 [Trametes cingulata]
MLNYDPFGQGTTEKDDSGEGMQNDTRIRTTPSGDSVDHVASAKRREEQETTPTPRQREATPTLMQTYDSTVKENPPVPATETANALWPDSGGIEDLPNLDTVLHLTRPEHEEGRGNERSEDAQSSGTGLATDNRMRKRPRTLSVPTNDVEGVFNIRATEAQTAPEALPLYAPTNQQQQIPVPQSQPGLTTAYSGYPEDPLHPLHQYGGQQATRNTYANYGTPPYVIGQPQEVAQPSEPTYDDEHYALPLPNRLSYASVVAAPLTGQLAEGRRGHAAPEHPLVQLQYTGTTQQTNATGGLMMMARPVGAHHYPPMTPRARTVTMNYATPTHTMGGHARGAQESEPHAAHSLIAGHSATQRPEWQATDRPWTQYGGTAETQRYASLETNAGSVNTPLQQSILNQLTTAAANSIAQVMKGMVTNLERTHGRETAASALRPESPTFLRALAQGLQQEFGRRAEEVTRNQAPQRGGFAEGHARNETQPYQPPLQRTSDLRLRPATSMVVTSAPPRATPLVSAPNQRPLRKILPKPAVGETDLASSARAPRSDVNAAPPTYAYAPQATTPRNDLPGRLQAARWPEPNEGAALQEDGGKEDDARMDVDGHQRHEHPRDQRVYHQQQVHGTPLYNRAEPWQLPQASGSQQEHPAAQRADLGQHLSAGMVEPSRAWQPADASTQDQRTMRTHESMTHAHPQAWSHYQQPQTAHAMQSASGSPTTPTVYLVGPAQPYGAPPYTGTQNYSFEPPAHQYATNLPPSPTYANMTGDQWVTYLNESGRLQITPVPPRRFPVVHHRGPFDLERHMSEMRLTQFLGERPGTTCVLEVFDHVIVNQRKAVALTRKLEETLRIITEVPKPSVAAPEKKQGWVTVKEAPTAWLVYGLHEQAVRILTEVHTWSTPAVTFFAYPHLQQIPRYVIGLLGFTRDDEDEALETVRAAFLRAPIADSIGNLLREHPQYNKLPPVIAVAELVKMMQVKIRPLVDDRPREDAEEEILVVHVYIDPPTLDLAKWQDWRTAMRDPLMTIQGRFNRATEPKDESRCLKCFGVDHDAPQCPSSNTPGWFGVATATSLSTSRRQNTPPPQQHQNAQAGPSSTRGGRGSTGGWPGGPSRMKRTT